jgi:proline dehydrogenase
MLRAFLLYLSHAGWAQNIALHWRLARAVALRFVAGETQEQALDAVRQLNDKGMQATLDVLGESITDAAQATAMKDAYLQLLDAICAAGLQAWVSLKLTALGLDIDEALCHENMRQILKQAKVCGLYVTIDMEDHPYTQRTLDLFHTLKDEDGFDNVRTVVQAYLYRSDDDIEALAEEGAGIRLCKGAYKEPAAVAHPKKADVDAAYLRQMKVLLDAAHAGRGYPGIATHDEAIIDEAKRYAAEQSIPTDAYEFQMLYGVRSSLQDQLAADGYGMRVYVPFGTQWYPYFVRRLAERPANVWFFISNLFKR